MKKYRVASILMIVHAGIELLGLLALIPILLLPNNSYDISSYFSFIVPCFQNNLSLMLMMGGIYGTIRLIGAIGLLQNKMWGLVLSVINCIVTMILMPLMLPAGIMDGLLSGSALLLILKNYYGNRSIIDA
ncbi:MAG: hypothetical protein ACOX3W_08485 [Christensenellaceae bacterium]